MDLLEMLEELTKISLKRKANGFVVIIDELENSIPYSYDTGVTYERPLAMRQLLEILKNRSSPNLGFVIGCRVGVFPLVERHLGLANLKKYVHEIDTLDTDDFQKLIELRYETWKPTHRPQFRKNAIQSIAKRTGSNTRDVIKYLRELYDLSMKEKKTSLSSTEVDALGDIPLFRY